MHQIKEEPDFIQKFMFRIKKIKKWIKWNDKNNNKFADTKKN